MFCFSAALLYEIIVGSDPQGVVDRSQYGAQTVNQAETCEHRGVPSMQLYYIKVLEALAVAYLLRWPSRKTETLLHEF